MTKPSAVILCIARTERPFIDEWMEYHIALGLEHIFYVSTDSDIRVISIHFANSSASRHVSLYHFNAFKPWWQMACYNRSLNAVEEQWVLISDIDEFLHPNPYTHIGEFLENIADDVGQTQCPWLDIFSGQYSNSQTLDVLGDSRKYASVRVKSLVRIESVTGLGNHHHCIHYSTTILSSGMEIELNHAHCLFVHDTSYYRQFPCILHFASRGHPDLIIRIIDPQYFNAKSGNSERNRLVSFLIGQASWETVPTRYLLSKILQCFPDVHVELSTQKSNAKTNGGSLQDIFLANIAKVVNFNCEDPELVVSAFENKFSLQKRLGELDLTGKIDLLEQLSCGSQLEYTGLLRNRLVAA